MLLVFPVVAVLAAAGAGPATLAIVEVEAPDMMVGLAGQVTRAVVSEAGAQKLAFVAPDELRARLQPKAFAELKKCGGKVVCVAQALDGLGLERAVVGTLGRDEKNYLLKLWLIDLKNLTVVADVDRAILIAARRLQKDLDEAVPRLLRGEREARGTLIIESNLADAQVTLNGEFLGTPPVTQALKPGKYEVKVERRKYLSVTRLLNVEAEKETRERFSLLLKPGEVADDQLPALATKAGSLESGAGLRLTTPTWVCGGLTLVGGGLSLFFSLSASGQERALLAGYNAATGVYAGTRREALAAQQNALLANVSYAFTAAALVATIIFLVRDATRVEVAPVVSAGGGAVVVGGHF
jgi:hypothetical protein